MMLDSLHLYRLCNMKNIFNKLKTVVLSKSGVSTPSSDERQCCDFKLQLLNLRLYSEEVDSLFCVTVVSDHLLSPQKGHPVKMIMDKNNVKVTWADSKNKSHVLCCHPLHSITYQFHTSFKPRLYGYTAAWGNKKICLVFQTPRFSRTKGIKIRQHYDRLLQYNHIPAPTSKTDPGCSNPQLTAQDKDGQCINTKTSTSSRNSDRPTKK